MGYILLWNKHHFHSKMTNRKIQKPTHEDSICYLTTIWMVFFDSTVTSKNSEVATKENPSFLKDPEFDLNFTPCILGVGILLDSSAA